MNFADQWATDEAGNRFLFTVEMQRKLSDAGLPVEPQSLSQLTGPKAERQSFAIIDEIDEPYEDEPPAEIATVKESPAEERASSNDELQPATVQIDPESGKYIGRLKWYNPGRGYGFIARGAGEDIFFHRSDMISDPEALEEGSWLLYDVEETQKGLEASEIELYSGDPSQLY